MTLLNLLSEFLFNFVYPYSSIELLKKRKQRSRELQPKQFQDFVKRLDEGLFRNASTKVPYSFFSFWCVFFLCNPACEVYILSVTWFSLERQH